MPGVITLTIKVITLTIKVITPFLPVSYLFQNLVTLIYIIYHIKYVINIV